MEMDAFDFWAHMLSHNTILPSTHCVYLQLWRKLQSPFYAGNIKDSIRNSRTPTLKNEPPFPYVSSPCFKRSPLPHLSLRWTGLTCGMWRHYSIIMEDKPCAKIKKNFHFGNESDKDAVLLVWRIIAFDLQCGDPRAPSVPSSLSPFWYCRLPCFNVLLLSFFCEPSVPETAEICGSSQCQNVSNKKFTEFSGFKGSNLSANSTYSSIPAEADVDSFIPPLMANINCNANNGY